MSTGPQACGFYSDERVHSYVLKWSFNMSVGWEVSRGMPLKGKHTQAQRHSRCGSGFWDPARRRRLSSRRYLPLQPGDLTCRPLWRVHGLWAERPAPERSRGLKDGPSGEPRKRL